MTFFKGRSVQIKAFLAACAALAVTMHYLPAEYLTPILVVLGAALAVVDKE